MPKMKIKRKHPWRKCPNGTHWVKGRKKKDGSLGKNFCRKNPSKKDQIYREELEYIKDGYFKNLKILPTKDNLDFKYRGSRYDAIIAGWTQFWNEVLKPKDPLDPNLVKALIATESGFDKEAKVYAGKKAGYARGLMQVTDWTLEILRDEKGELTDHLVNLYQKDMIIPNYSIAAGTRWLFRKKETASSKLKRQASWMEAVADYKSYLLEWEKNPKHKQMNKLIKLYERLSK